MHGLNMNSNFKTESLISKLHIAFAMGKSFSCNFRYKYYCQIHIFIANNNIKKGLEDFSVKEIDYYYI